MSKRNSGGGAGVGGGGLLAGVGKHDYKLPKDRGRLRIDVARAALKQMGLTLGATNYDFATKTSVTELTYPNGKKAKVSGEQIAEIVYQGQRK
jgi:hypothetical protein